MITGELVSTKTSFDYFFNMNNAPPKQFTSYPAQVYQNQSNPQRYQQQRPDIPVSFLYPNRERKIIANICGMIFTVMLILLLFACIVYRVLVALEYVTAATDLSIITGYDGPPSPSLNVNVKKQMLSLVLYYFICFIFVYFPIRALFKKQFSAGRPSKLQMWPLAIAVVFRVVHEIVVKANIDNFFRATVLTLCVALFIFITYTVDDDNLRGKINLKPWVFVKEN